MVYLKEKKRRIDPDKAFDVPFRFVIVEGVELVSRYGKLDEYLSMMKALKRLTPYQRQSIASIYCDSKIGDAYSVTLKRKPETKIEAGLIIRALYNALWGPSFLFIDGDLIDDDLIDDLWQ